MGGEKRNFLKELVAFNIIGIINTIVTYGIYALLVFLGLHYLLALFLEYCFGMTFSFFANRKFTFHHTGQISLRMAVSMIGSYAGVLVLNMVLLVVFIEKISFNEYIAQFFALAICVAVSFLAQKFIVFRKKKN